MTGTSMPERTLGTLDFTHHLNYTFRCYRCSHCSSCLSSSCYLRSISLILVEANPLFFFVLAIAIALFYIFLFLPRFEASFFVLAFSLMCFGLCLPVCLNKPHLHLHPLPAWLPGCSRGIQWGSASALNDTSSESITYTFRSLKNTSAISPSPLLLHSELMQLLPRNQVLASLVWTSMRASLPRVRSVYSATPWDASNFFQVQEAILKKNDMTQSRVTEKWLMSMHTILGYHWNRIPSLYKDLVMDLAPC